MKFDSESPYHYSRPSPEHETKVIVHSDNPFILAKDNHFLIDMLKKDDGAQKEGKHGHKSPIERKSSNVTSPPKQYLDIENTLYVNKNYDDYVEPLYSAPPSRFEMIVKDDFYTDKIVTNVELPEMRVHVEDGPCHIVREISVDESVQPSNKSLVEREDVNPIEFATSNRTLKNGILEKNMLEKEQVTSLESSMSNQSLDFWHSKSKMAGSACADDSEYGMSNSPIIIVNDDKLTAASVLYDSIDGNGSSVDSFNHTDMLGTTPLSNMSPNVTENLGSPASVFHNDYDGKGSCRSLINSTDNLEPINLVSRNISAELSEIRAVQDIDVNSDCDGKGSFVGPIGRQNKPDACESVASIIYSKGSSASSINSEGNVSITKSVLGNISVEVPENQAVLISDVRDDITGKGFHVSSICSIYNLNTDESVVSNISGKGSSVSLLYSKGSLDITKSAETDMSADVQNDSEEKGSYDSSIDVWNKLDTYEPVASNVSAEVVENQLPPSQEITAKSSQVNSSSQTFSNDQKQSVDGQQFQAISEETNSVCPAAFIKGSKEISANCKVSSEVITFSFDPQEACTSGRDKNRETTNNQKSEVAQNSLETEEAMINGPSASITSLHFIQDEANLFGPALLSGHNANLGNIPNSGSVSLRSESSTTSTRSFAFPILQSEWNSSPVKMAKADRRHLRKHRGWRVGLFCCRF